MRLGWTWTLAGTALLAGCGGGLCISIGPGGCGVADVFVDVELTVDPPAVAVGTPATLSWTTRHAASCTASGAWSGPKAVAGTQVVVPQAPGTARYRLTCLDALGDLSTGGEAVVDLVVSR